MFLSNANVVLISDNILPSDKLYGWARAAGPYRIATEIRKNGYTCQVIDCFTSLTEDEKSKLLNECVGDDTLMVGISSTFIAKDDDAMSPYPYDIEQMKQYFDTIKLKNPSTKIVYGGAKADSRNAPGVDAIIVGLSDKAIIEYLKFLQGKNPFFTYESSDDFMIVDADNHNQGFNFVESKIQYEPEDNVKQQEVLPIEISRGCIFKCSFCSFALNGKKKNDHIKKPETIREEFIHNFEKYGATKYILLDDTFNDSIDKLEMLADVSQSLPFKLQVSAYMRLDLIRAHPRQYQLLKDIGLYACFFGIETLNYKSAQTIGKGLHPDKVVEELHKFRDTMPEVGTSAGFICGLPYETKDSIIKWGAQLYNGDFPLDAFSMKPLYISQNQNKKYKSEFETDFDKWYTWKPSSIGPKWDNGSFDLPWAKWYADYFLFKARQVQRVGGWQSMMLENVLPIGYNVHRRPLIDIMKEMDPSVIELEKRRYVDRLFTQVCDK